MEESAEQVLARLETWVASIGRQPETPTVDGDRSLVAARARIGVATAYASIAAARDTLVMQPPPAAMPTPMPMPMTSVPAAVPVMPAPADRASTTFLAHVRESTIVPTLIAHAMVVLGGVLTIGVFLALRGTVAPPVVAVLAVAGIVVGLRRTPYALWWTLGVVGAGLACWLS